jgi:hypothetical protein
MTPHDLGSCSRCGNQYAWVRRDTGLCAPCSIERLQRPRKQLARLRMLALAALVLVAAIALEVCAIVGTP